jgi:hypothetical protein
MRGETDLRSFERGDPFEFGRGASRNHSLGEKKYLEIRTNFHHFLDPKTNLQAILEPKAIFIRVGSLIAGPPLSIG